MAKEVRELKNWKLWWVWLQYMRSHLDVFIEQCLGVKLKDTQKVEARAIGNGTDVKIVSSRGYGKSWIIGHCAFALAILYPETNIAIVSATAAQATIVMRKIRDFVGQYPEYLKEVDVVGRDPVPISKEKGVVWIKNGSKIESFSLSTIVGERAKIIIVDEAPRAKEEDIKKGAIPVLNTTRDKAVQIGFEDYESKLISITSACLKSNYFFRDFVTTYKKMKSGDPKAFACALDYKSAIRIGITKAAYFEERRQELPESVFATEYESIFVGDEANSVLPFELTEPMRNLRSVEYTQPKGTSCWYVMSVDIATSKDKDADNAALSVIKCIDREDGSIMKHLVYMRTYHGRRLDELAEEIRRTYVRFPNIQRVVFDQRGLGDSLPSFLSSPWVDPETNKEYPAWITQDENVLHGIQMLYGFKANVQLNQELITALRVALEQKTLCLPMSSRDVTEDDGNNIKLEEKLIYIEADALQVEMGNIIAKSSGAGNVLYDTAKSTQHKDRYSSIAMGVWYIAQIEAENKRRIAQQNQDMVVGIVSYL